MQLSIAESEEMFDVEVAMGEGWTEDLKEMIELGKITLGSGWKDRKKLYSAFKGISGTYFISNIIFYLNYMDSDFKLTAPQAPLEPMNFLSRTWCNSAIQAFQTTAQDGSVFLQDNQIKAFENDIKAPQLKMDKSINMDDANVRSIPAWKSNDLKSWIWMQQAMHPELNYDSCFRKKWIIFSSDELCRRPSSEEFWINGVPYTASEVSWKLAPFKNFPIKKWWKEIKQKRKEEERLQRAEVHAAISIAGVATALAAIAVENTKHNEPNTTKEAAVASAAALVAAQCKQMAEAMGAKPEQLSTVMGSAMTSNSASDILTLTAAAATSLRGAATLRARPGRRNRVNGRSPVLPLEENNDFGFDFDKCRSLLAKGAQLSIETPDGKRMMKSVSVILNNEAKVILKIRKINLLTAFASPNESVVLDLHAELYKDSDAEETDTSYLIVLTTSRGMIKLDMADDNSRYTMWATTLNHMLMLSTSFTRYELQFYKN
ncbi:hypothetical protein HHK36_013739 [Tetracentron sinense]|uniref:Uncharacterized protein n=1 Tax=Tetracentron sinense TaxID=13715 RepID=A0A835DEP9_TETSI|nr:hypothetical protein HHK36_013739 [Tetracentron sinense]